MPEEAAGADADIGEDAADVASLAERMRERLREVAQADEAALERALAAKEGLAERMRAVRGGRAGQDEPVRDVEPDVARRADELDAFARRLAQLAMEPTVEEAPANDQEAEVPEDTIKDRLLRFVGRRPPAKRTGPVTPVPPFDEAEWEEVASYGVDPPYAFARILRNHGTGEHLYQVIEPRLDAEERRILDFVTDALVRSLDMDPARLDATERADYLEDAVGRILHDYRIRVEDVSRQRILYYIRRDFLGLAEIHALMNDPDIEDISCDGAAEPLFIYHRDHESIATDVRFAGDVALDSFVIRLAQRSGKAISISDPILDAALPDGSRLQATLGKEVTQNGSTFTIRRFRPDPFTPLDLVAFGTMDDRMLAWFWLIVQHGHSLIFSGGTASGKTTGLNAISQFIPPAAKVVSIEDTREVNLAHHNWIKAVTRSGSSAEGSGEIGMFELLKAALRQRPEYILVGEVRGIEATVAFQAMATGHTVYSTMHADSARSVVYRLENDPINIPRLVLQALDVIVIQAQVRVEGRRVRRIREVVELVGMDPITRELLTNTVFKWDPLHDRFEHSGRSYLLERIARERSWSPQRLQEEAQRRERVLGAMRRKGVSTVQQITAIVKAYYRDAEATERMLEALDVP